MKIRNISGEDRVVAVRGIPRTVAANAVIDVPAAEAPGMTCQEATWRAESTPSKSEKE